MGMENSITQFTLTEYGRLINEGLAEYKKGHYEKSAEIWREVLKHNGNYDQAYIGIGRALLREKKYKEAMEYFGSRVPRSNLLFVSKFDALPLNCT